jgi:hypothetical protein
MMSLWEALIRSFSEFFNLSSPISFGTNQFYLILAMGMFLVAYGSILSVQNDANPGWTALAVGVGGAFAFGLAMHLDQNPSQAAWLQGMCLFVGSTAEGVSLALGLRLIAPHVVSLVISIAIPLSFAGLWWAGLVGEGVLPVLSLISLILSLLGIYSMLFRDILASGGAEPYQVKGRSCVAAGYVLWIGASASYTPELLTTTGRTLLVWVTPVVAGIGMLMARSDDA